MLVRSALRVNLLPCLTLAGQHNDPGRLTSRFANTYHNRAVICPFTLVPQLISHSYLVVQGAEGEDVYFASTSGHLSFGDSFFCWT